MAIRFGRLSSPHCLLNGASKDIRRDRATLQAQWNPGKVGKFTTIQLWINCPLMSSPETINANDRVRQRRGGGDGVDVGTQDYESKSPLICRGPTGINEMGWRRHDSTHLRVS